MVKVEKKFVVQKNAQIKDIYKNLNSVQKKAVLLFDRDRNGTLDKDEAKAFNSTIFSLQKNGDLDIYLRLQSGKQVKETVKKDEMDTTTLSLGWTRTTGKVTKQGNKYVRTVNISQSIEKDNSSESLAQKKAENSRGYKLVSTDANGNSKYISEDVWATRLNSGKCGDMKGLKEYIVLDASGNVIEYSKINTIGESEYYVGKTIHKGNKEEYYDENNKCYGKIEQQPDGKTKILDGKGNTLYYIKDNVRYDANGVPKYKATYKEGYYDPRTGNSDIDKVTVEYLDKNGKTTKTVEAIPNYQAYSNPADRFKKLEDNPVESGIFTEF